jgi:hypothetical protein
MSSTSGTGVELGVFVGVALIVPVEVPVDVDVPVAVADAVAVALRVAEPVEELVDVAVADAEAVADDVAVPVGAMQALEKFAWPGVDASAPSGQMVQAEAPWGAKEPAAQMAHVTGLEPADTAQLQSAALRESVSVLPA